MSSARILSSVSSASRSIFGHLGSASPYGPQFPGLRRSPRKYLQSKLKGGNLVGWHHPFVQPTMMSGKRYRQIERLEEGRIDKTINDLGKVEREERAAQNRLREEESAARRVAKKAERIAAAEAERAQKK